MATKDPLIIAEGFATAIQEAFGPELKSLILVGSAARGDFIPGKSDVNTLIVLTPAGMDSLEKATPILKAWQGKGIAIPHFFLHDSICRSLDSYPLEMLDFKCFHKLLKGVDVFKGLVIPRPALRLQVEREARGKLYLLRRALVTHAARDKELANVLKASLSAFTVIFQGILELEKKPISEDRGKVFAGAAEIVGFSADVFTRIHDLKRGQTAADAKGLYRELLRDVGKMVAWVDGYKIEESNK